MKLKTSKQAVKAGFLILALLFWCASLWGQRFSEIIVFGDSLSDTGNTHIASGGFHYQPPYFEGRATNGETWVEYLARDLGLDVAAVGPYTLGGLNFAHGYAETGPGYRKLRDRGGVEVPVGPIPNVGEQIEIFISTGHSIAPDGLVVIWAGANDLIFNLLEGADPNVLISTVLTNLNGHISELIALGARNFLVLGQPDYGLTPLGLVADPAGLSFVAAVYNSNLEGMLNAIGTAAPHLTLYYSDTASIIQELVADPAAYGLVDVMNPTLDPNGADFFFAGYTGIDPETSLFWDLVHPTTLGHQLLADSIEFPPVEVFFDILPFRDSNTIHGRKRGPVLAAVYSAPGFDAATIDPDTVTVSGAPIQSHGRSSRLRAAVIDNNWDGLPDLVFSLSLADLPEITQDGTLLELQAETMDGVPVAGVDILYRK